MIWGLRMLLGKGTARSGRRSLAACRRGKRGVGTCPLVEVHVRLA